MNRTQIIYLLTLYVLVISFGLYLNTASGQEYTLSCRQYLNICEKSCAEREGVYVFQCFGPGIEQQRVGSGCRCFDEVRPSRPDERSAQLRPPAIKSSDVAKK